MKLILSRKLLPVTGQPVTNGAVCIKDGKILEFGARGRLLGKYTARARLVDLGDSLVMPGLVNAHTHLELSHLPGRLGEPDGFFEWISRLIEARRKIGADGLAKAASGALKAAVRSGTTCMGDISATDLALPALIRSGIRAVVFLEIIGMDDSEADRSFKRLLERIDKYRGMPERISSGISPHSTYSVSGGLYNRISKLILDNGLGIAVHLSETIDEVKQIKGEKSLMDGYHTLTGWEAHKKNRADSPLGFVLDKGLSRGLLAVHAVHVSAGDIRRMAASGVSVAHCPRSNHMLRVGRAPVGRMMEKGVNVAIGTDSLASNLDIDLWEEMRFAWLVNRLSAQKVIEMATINGARALGLEQVTGSIEPGKAADLIAVTGPAAKARDPYAPLLRETRPGNIVLGMVDGKIIYKNDDLKV